jgi:hypothetical protein
LAAHSWNGGSDLSDKYALISTVLKALEFPMVELITESAISDLNGRVGPSKMIFSRRESGGHEMNMLGMEKGRSFVKRWPEDMVGVRIEWRGVLVPETSKHTIFE